MADEPDERIFTWLVNHISHRLNVSLRSGRSYRREIALPERARVYCATIRFSHTCVFPKLYA